MMKNFFVGLFLLGLFSSCAAKKDIIYLQDAENSVDKTFEYFEPKIQPNDILRVNITAFPMEPAVPYNRIIPGNNNQTQNQIIEGYLVNSQGEITLPILGNIKASEKTPIELQKSILDILISGGHLTDPVVEVRILNNKFSVLGEVNSPGTYSFNEYNLTILQALGIAGDLTINGKRKDILVVREINGVRETATIDLTSADLFNSPFYFIKPNDAIIVDPNGPKVKSAGFIGNVGSLLSVFTILLSTTLLLTR